MKRLCSVVAALLYSAAMAGAQSPEQLEQQLQELKQQYAETTRLMEQRIATLEQQIAAQRAAASAATKENTVSLPELVAEAEKSTSPRIRTRSARSFRAPYRRSRHTTFGADAGQIGSPIRGILGVMVLDKRVG